MLKRIVLILALILLTSANGAAAEDEAPFEPLAAAYSENGREVLALIKMKEDGSLGFMVISRNVEPVAFVPYDRKIYDFYLNKNQYDEYPPLMFLMILPGQARGQVDDDLGAWEDNVHSLPIYALFNVDGGKVVCEKPFYSASSLSPSHYHGTVRNINHTRLIEIFMTQMPKLHEVVQASGITLP